MKKIVLSFFIFSVMASSAFAQSVAVTSDAVGRSEMVAPIMLIILVAAVVVFALWAILRTNTILYNRLVEMDYQSRGLVAPVLDVSAEVESVSYWEKFRKKYWEDIVPMEKEHTIMRTHSFDGIRELDNNLPPWWINMFYATIAAAFMYMYYYEWGGSDWSSTKQYDTEMAIAKKEKAAALANAKESINESNVTFLADAGALGEGATIFKANCAACHGQAGEGVVGPNMTDEYWIHGGTINNIFRIIQVGVPEKGMQAWAAQLRPSDMQKVASYILSLQGTKPANPKAHEGVKAEATAVPVDTSSTTVKDATSTTKK